MTSHWVLYSIAVSHGIWRSEAVVAPELLQFTMLGAIGALHTNTRRLDYHQHVHLVMPAAATDRQRRLWRTKLWGNGRV